MEQSWTSACLVPLAPWLQHRSLRDSHPGASPAAPSGLWPGLSGLGLGLFSTHLPWRTEEGFGVRVPNQPASLLPVLPANERIRPSAGCRSEVAPHCPLLYRLGHGGAVWGHRCCVLGGCGTFSLEISEGCHPVQGASLWGEPREGGHCHVLHLLSPPGAQSLWELP